MPKPFKEQLIDAIRQAQTAGISRYRLAKMSGVSQAYLSRIVNRKTTPSLTSAEKILYALGKKISIS